MVYTVCIYLDGHAGIGKNREVWDRPSYNGSVYAVNIPVWKRRDFPPLH